VKAQIINLLSRLQKKLDMSLLFISHDRAIVEHLTPRVMVMYLGVIVEIGDRDLIFSRPRHPYTRALISSVPVADPDAVNRRIVLSGDVPSPTNPPKGCRFHTRCPYAFDRCRVEQPILRSFGSERQRVACHLEELPDIE
jgi:peptide/nickel transport system ATP-binding protein